MRTLVHLVPWLLGSFAVMNAEEDGWPQKFKAPPAKVVSAAPPEEVNFAYETANFRLHADEQLNPARLARFAQVIESVPMLLRALPLPLWAPPKGDKPRIILCRDTLSYQSKGGPLGSMGFYDGRRQRILIRADIFLNPPPTQPTRLLPKPNEDLLVHELTHLGMHELLWRTSPWFFEGLAEYLAAGHVAGGSYDFTQMDRSIRDHVRRYLQPDENNVMALPSLQFILTTTGRQWIEGNKRSPGHLVYRPYGSSLLLVHYYLHGKARRKEVGTYLDTALAYRDRRRPLPRLAVPSPEDIETRLIKYWQPKGLPIQFEQE